jgi:hypothetical protein
LKQVVNMDRKYQLPKLEENTRRLAALQARIAERDHLSSFPEART